MAMRAPRGCCAANGRTVSFQASHLSEESTRPTIPNLRNIESIIPCLYSIRGTSNIDSASWHESTSWARTPVNMASFSRVLSRSGVVHLTAR